MQGGARGLWVGITPTLIAAVPMVGIYMPLYDLLRDRFEPTMGSVAAPLTASSIARAIAVICVAPLEVLRTRLMSGRQRKQPVSSACCSTSANVPRLTLLSRPTTPGGWWRGLNATVCTLATNVSCECY